MNRKLISIACEGPHDVAFLNRILKAHGFTTDEKIKIGEYPPPMGGFFEGSAKRSDFKQLNFAEARLVPLPSHALVNGNVSIFLYSLGGDSKKAERAALLQRLALFIPANENEISAMSPDTSLAMVFMFDADTAGVDARLTSIRREIADAMEIHLDAVAILSNGACCAIKGLCVGCLVLTDESLETGKLEDVLLPLMRKENEGIFASAEDFIDGHFDVERTKFLRIRLKEGALYEARGSDKDFDRKKSLIGVVAQLQISGKPNQACINRTDYLNMSKLTTAPVTAPIRKFIETITNFT